MVDRSCNIRDHDYFYQAAPERLEYLHTAACIDVAVLLSDLNISWFWTDSDAGARDRPLPLDVNPLVQALAFRYAGRPLPLHQ